MTWYAKPKGAYSYTSDEGISNIYEMASCFPAWTTEAKAGCIGNSYHEGGLNPWRWQYDKESSIPDLGYGLFQYSPGTDYIYLSYSKPNLSTTHITPEAEPEDGQIQCEVMASDVLGKWVSSCWRTYWNTSTYSDLYEYRNEILSLYGDGNSISLAQFGQCTDLEACTFIFLACFEGPKIPNFTVRKATANKIYEILGGTPITPEPVPPTPVGTNIPPWLLKKIKDNNTRKY